MGFDVKHALECQLGGYRVTQHDETRDTIAGFLREAGHLSVEVEPQLQPLVRSLSTKVQTRKMQWVEIAVLNLEYVLCTHASWILC